MGMNETPSADRVHIGFFGRRNAGKSTYSVATETIQWIPFSDNVCANMRPSVVPEKIRILFMNFFLLFTRLSHAN